MKGLPAWPTLVLALSSAGCTVTAVSAQDDSRPSNTCESDSDCSSGNCGAGVCQAVDGQLDTLLISVSPESDDAIPNLAFVAHLTNVPTSGGVKDIELSEPGHVAGSLVLPPKAACYPTLVSPDPDKPIFAAQDGRSLPVQVQLERRERLLGVPQQSYFTRTDYEVPSFGFELTVPAGEYDIYMVPPATLPDCPLPPQLRRAWPIEAGDFTVPFPVAPIASLTVHVRWPKQNDSLKGWQVDMIEPIGGKTISTIGTLGEPIDGEQSVEYVATLAYSEVIEPEGTTNIESANDLLRLRPPANVVAPTLFFDRSGLSLVGNDAPDPTLVKSSVTLKVPPALPKAVTVEGQLARAGTGTPVSGAVTLLSMAVSGIDNGSFASYQASATADESGVFRIDLPPGKYQVRAVPSVLLGPPELERQALAASEATWDIPADVPFQAGKLLELSPLNEVTGQSRFPGAQVEGLPTPLNVLPFEEGFGKGDFLPRAASDLVDEVGHFTLLADPGRFDISVQAPDSLGFAWYVRPGVDVREARQDLGRVSLPTPVAVTGTVTVGSGSTKLPVGSGIVRAYAYLNKDFAYTSEPKEAVSVVQVAETRADERGEFRLLLPSSLTASK